jgi:hypothetical protein
MNRSIELAREIIGGPIDYAKISVVTLIFNYKATALKVAW